MSGTCVCCAPVLPASDCRHTIIKVQEMLQKALREHILALLYVGVCGFPNRLKLHLQKNTPGTERRGLRLSEGQWGLSLGLVRVEWDGTTSTPERPSAQTSVVVNGPW